MEYIRVKASGPWGLLRFPGARAWAYEKVTIARKSGRGPRPMESSSAPVDDSRMRHNASPIHFLIR